MSNYLKDLYNKEYISLLTDNIHSIDPTFKKQKFIEKIFIPSWKTKELKQRMSYISTCINEFLVCDYKKSIKVLKKVFLQMNDKFYLENMIFQDYVGQYGLDDFETSMSALEVFTINSSSEFAIRSFILKYEDLTLKKMQIWARSENIHVRRLSCEGLRPRLPWAFSLSKFKENPQKIIKILNILKDDKEKYVQKSVANCLNDISKDNPEVIKNILKKWINKNKSRDWILKHGCRTLLKQGDSEVLEVFGFKDILHVEIKDFKLSLHVQTGGVLHIEFILKSKEALGKLRIEYMIEFVRLNNKTNKKVFKISEGVFDTKEKLINKKHSFKKITTRKYYQGKHKLSLIINGRVLETKSFFLN